MFNLSFGLYNTKCLSVYNCILKDFSSDGFLHIYYMLPLFPAIPTDMLRFLFVAHAFFAHVLCNSPYGLRQAQNMSGSVLLTTEASQLSVGIAENSYIVFIWKILG